MMFLAISRNAGDPSRFLTAEAARIAELSRSGQVTRILLKTDHTGAVLLMEEPDLSAAQATIDTLPLVSAGIATFQLTSVFEPPDSDPPGSRSRSTH